LTNGSRPRRRRPRSDASRGAPRRPRQVRALRGTSLVRLRIGFLLITMIVSVFAVRLFQLQGVDAQAYVAKARAEGVVTVNLPATRGTITDRNGVPLADSVDGLMIVADPTLTIRHANQIATIIARRLDVDYFDVLQRLRKPYTHFQYIARRVPATKARAVVAAIDRRGYKGIDTRRDPVRSYPGDDVAANLIGFMNAEGQAGEGAELMFDKLLSGTDGRATYEIGGGNRIPLGDNSTVPPRSGHNLKLTIDSDVQWYAQRALRDAVQSVNGDSGSAVVMDTHTGQLLPPSTRTTPPSRRTPTSALAPCATSTSRVRWRRCSPPRRCSTRARSRLAPRSWCLRCCSPTTGSSTTTSLTARCT
jgi:cell division protein FtsI (penicillin-binding protein 3)